MRTKRFLAVGAMALGLVAIVLGLSMRLGANSAQAAATDPGDATFTVNSAAVANQPLATPFNVTVDLSGSFGPTNTSWAGYDLEVDYDPAVLSLSTAPTPGLCPLANWANPPTVGAVTTGCSFATVTNMTGTLETMQFTCIANGTSPLGLLPHYDAKAVFAGNALFDSNGLDFNMTLVGGNVICGTPPSPTATFTQTNTPVPTNTFTPTATRTPTATNTPVTPTATNTPCPGGVCPTNTPTATGTATQNPIFWTATPTGSPSVAAGTETATSVPGQPTTAATKAPTGSQPGGGAGAGGAGPRITLPDTGSRASGDNGMGGLWLVVAGIALATLGGGMLVTARKRA